MYGERIRLCKKDGYIIYFRTKKLSHIQRGPGRYLSSGENHMRLQDTSIKSGGVRQGTVREGGHHGIGRVWQRVR